MKARFRWVLWAALFATACTREEAPPVWLEGSWKAEVFDGVLYEHWDAPAEGRMLRKSAVYVENGDTLYSEQARFDTIAGRVYLMAWPVNADPLIFEMTDETPTTMTFENRRFQNPFRIRYQMTGQDHFVRTVMGIQNGDTVVTEYRFERTAPGGRTP